MEDALAEDERAIRRPREVMQRVMAILRAEAAEQHLLHIGPVIAIGVLKVDEVRLLRAIHAALAIEFKAERDLQVIGPDLARVRAAIAVGVLQDEDFVLRLLAGHDLWIGHRGADPQAPTRIPPNADRLHEVREVLLAHEAVHLEARVNLEGLQFVCRAEPFVDGTVTCDGREWIQGGIQSSLVAQQRVRRTRVAARLGYLMNQRIAICHHALQLLQLAREVHHAIRFLASAGDVVAIERPIATEELLVLLFHHSAHVRIYLGRCFLEQTLVERSSEGGVACVVQVDGVVVKMARREW